MHDVVAWERRRRGYIHVLYIHSPYTFNKIYPNNHCDLLNLMFAYMILGKVQYSVLYHHLGESHKSIIYKQLTIIATQLYYYCCHIGKESTLMNLHIMSLYVIISET